MSKFDRNRIKDGWEKLRTNKQTDRHYENNGHLAVKQQGKDSDESTVPVSNNENNSEHETSADDSQYHANAHNEQHSACN